MMILGLPDTANEISQIWKSKILSPTILKKLKNLNININFDKVWHADVSRPTVPQ